MFLGWLQVAYTFPGSAALVGVLAVPLAPVVLPSLTACPAVAWAGCSHSAGGPGTLLWNAGLERSLGPCFEGLGGPLKEACLAEGASCRGRQPSCSVGHPSAVAGHTSRIETKKSITISISPPQHCTLKCSDLFLPCYKISWLCTGLYDCALAGANPTPCWPLPYLRVAIGLHLTHVGQLLLLLKPHSHLPLLLLQSL